MYDENKQLMEELPAIIFAVQAGERNKFDQLKIFYFLRNEFVTEKTHGVIGIMFLPHNNLT